MVQSIVRIAEFLNIPPKVFSYIATIAITVAFTVPATVTVQSASQMQATLDTVVVNQRRLEKSLTSIFGNVGERLNEVEYSQRFFYKLYFEAQEIQNEMLLELGEDTKWYDLHQEKINSMERAQESFMYRDEK